MKTQGKKEEKNMLNVENYNLLTCKKYKQKAVRFQTAFHWFTTYCFVNFSLMLPI